MRGPVVDEAKVALVQKLRRKGLTVSEVAAARGVSVGSVRRYTNPRFREQSNEAIARYRQRGGRRLTFEERAERYRLDRSKPLYDPKQHELELQSLTAELMGDPRPGRREMVENAPRPLDHAESQARRQPWSPLRGASHG